MRVKLDYGTDGLCVDVPDERVTVITPAFRPAVADPHAALLDAIRAPHGRPPLRDIVRRGQTIAISVCDITRAQPRRATLRALFEEMPDIRDEDVTILIATGTHRINTPSELDAMLGADIVRRYRVLNHDSRDPGSLVDVGTTSTGVPVRLNRAWVGADVRITTGFVEPHFFAGFSGGPKMVAPGLAGLDTVLELHSPARIADARSTFGVVDGNPVQDGVRAIAMATGVTFAVDVLIDDQHRITHAFGGPVLDMHAVACRTAREVAMQGVGGPCDVVLSTNSGYPLDRNLYQAVKGMAAAATVVAEGGTIILAAECRDGVPDDSPYARLLHASPSIEAVGTAILQAGHTIPEGWQAQVQARIQARARVLLKSSLPDADVRRAHLEPIQDVGVALAAVLKRQPGARVCVIPEGPQTIPYLRS